MKNTNTVVIVSGTDFPSNDAGALRIEAFALTYKQLGYAPIVICRNNSGIKEGIHNSIPFFSQRFNIKLRPRFLDLLVKFIFHEVKTYQFIKYIFKNNDVKLIHLYTGTHWLWRRVARKKKIEVVTDVVEWYSPDQFRMGRFDPSFLLKEYTNRFLINKQEKVVAISRCLEDYFVNKQIESIRIPVVLDVQENSPSIKTDGSKIKIVYCGSFNTKKQKKDLLIEIIDTFADLSFDNNKLELHIIGVDENAILKTGIISKERLHRENCRIFFYGKVKHSVAIQYLRSMDFSILLRPATARYAQAGFPTKVVEAMSNGLAMVCNLTSDLDIYLKDNENSLLLADESKECLQNAFEKINRLSSDEVLRLRRNARSTALNCFDYRKYIQPMQSFLDKERR